MSSIQTAVVVGPPGEEIHTDKYGRVKVQFHWDREGKRDDNTSCWIRVSQAHSGKAFGGIDIPRVGEEVVVSSFLEGDLDRPLITGRVYHEESMPPFGLPGEKTRSGMKTKTYKGGGYNELSMDDTPGKEQIRIHGQHNMDTVIENDETHTIHNNRTKKVDVNETMSIGNNQQLSVGVNKTVSVGANHSEAVGANQSVTVGTNQTNTVGVMKNETIGAVSVESVGVAKLSTVGAAYALTVGGAKNEAVGFYSFEEIGFDKYLVIGGVYDITVGGDATQEIGGNHKLTVDMDSKQTIKKNLELDVAKKIEIKCGASRLTMEDSGKVTIEGVDVTMKSGAGTIHIDGGGIITIKGPMVKINT